MSDLQTRNKGRRARIEPENRDYRPRRQQFEEPEPGPVGQRLTAVALSVVIIVFLVAYALSVVTSRSVAGRILARAIPGVTEVDQLVALNAASLQTQAQTSRSPQQQLTLTGFPIRVNLSAQEVRSLSPQGLEQVLEQRGADAIYNQGAAAFTAPGESSTNETGPLLSATWTIHEAFRLLNGRQHVRFTKVAEISGALALLLALLFCLQVGSYGRIVGVGVCLLGSAVVIGAISLLVWFVIQLYSSGTGAPLVAAGWGIFSDVTWVMVLIDGIAAATGAALLIIGLVCAALARGPAPRLSPEATRFAPHLERRRRRTLDD